MINIQDYEKEFKQLGICTTEASVVTAYLNELASIGISYLNNKLNQNGDE